MEIVPLSDELREAWDEFCLRSPDAWFWHTSAWLDYNLAYRPDMRQRSLSFMCKEGSQIEAVVPLLLGEEQKLGRLCRVLSLSGNPLPPPALPPDLLPGRRQKILDRLFRIIEGMARELGVHYASFQLSPIAPAQLQPQHAPYNTPLRYGYLDCSISSQIVDLRLSADELWKSLRRDHQRNVERARESIEVRIFSRDSVSSGKFDEYRTMHARAAGRVTRPMRTFELMHQWIISGAGFLAEAKTKADGKTIGFETFHGYKNAVYSFSACNEPGHEHLPIRHLIQWEALLWMKQQGFHFYEVGNQQFGILPHDFPEQKNLDISAFKGGFGGFTVPIFRAERFFDRDLWVAESTRRAQLFESRFNWSQPRDEDVAKALLRAVEESGAKRVRESEVLPIPDSARASAAAALNENPDSVTSFRNGSKKAVAFLVGAALRRAPPGLDPRFVRRAIEEALASETAAPPSPGAGEN